MALSDEEFMKAMAERREKLKLTRNDLPIGCPLCMIMPPTQPAAATSAANR